jgi:hypothetical protein
MYQNLIREEVARQGFVGTNPRWVEAYMRLEHPTLDGLSRAQFSKEISIAIQCIKADGEENAERLAVSYRL